jgi:hypothetical protein
MKQNSVVLILGSASASPGNHNIRQLTLKIYNSIDMLPHKQGEHNDKDIKGYLENDKLEERLNTIVDHLMILGSTFLDVDEIRKEG